MPERILVLLRNHDCIADILPYLQFVARPGIEIIFLIQSDENRYPWWLEHAGTVASPVERTLSIASLETILARRQRVLLAQERVRIAQKFLQGKEVEVRFEFYAGSRKKVTESYRLEDHETIILASGKLRRLQRLLTILRQRFGRVAPQPHQPVPAMMLIHPNRHL